MTGFAAVLDACVLVPISLADTLLRLAERGLYQPLWSVRILEEAQRDVAHVHPDLDPERIGRRFTDLDAAFVDSCVRGWEPLVDAITLPDPDDRHVVAVGIRGSASAVVTANLQDFPEVVLEAVGMHPVHPDDFLLDQLDLAPREVHEVIREQAAATRAPRQSPDEVLSALGRAGVGRFAEAVRSSM